MTGSPGVVTADALRQKLQIRLGIYQGEWPLDTTVGIPWLTRILGKQANRADGENVLRQAILTCPGVASVTSFQITYNADRTASLTFSVQSVGGENVTVADFVPGSVS